MDRFDQLSAFVAVADCGGFNAAARRIGRSAPTVTRLVAALEERLGTRLFTRTTRRVALTEAGARLHADAARLLDALETAEGAAAGAHEAPQGLLSVTAPTIFGRRYVAPLVRGFLDAHPQVRARMLFVDRTVDLIEEGMDVAVRLGELPDSGLTALRVGEVRRVVVASPAYLTAHGRPERPEDLADHRLAVSGTGSDAPRWEFHWQAERLRVPVAPALSGNAIDAAIEAALAGWAVARVLSYQVATELREGRLVELLPGFEDRRMPVHLLHAEGPLRAAKIRAFVDHAAKGLRREAGCWLP